MKTNLLIKSITEKTSKTGRRFHSVESDTGNISCFEPAIIENLQKNLGKVVSVEVEETNGFKNLRKFYGEAEEKEAKEVVKQDTRNENGKKAGMIVSYVKDLVVAGKVEFKDFERTAINLFAIQSTLENL
jgi:hypothetical protein